MTNNTSIIREIQRDLITSNIPLSITLNKAYLASRKLKLHEFSNWIENEIQGYKGHQNIEIPSYRHIPLRPHYKNPYNGWQPIVFDNGHDFQPYKIAILTQPVTELEHSATRKNEQLYYYPENLSAWLSTNLSRRMGLNTAFEVAGLFSGTNLSIPLNSIRKILLDWSLDLESNSILGEGLGFTQTEAEKAMTVTQHIYAQNIGIVGDVSKNNGTEINIKNSLTESQIRQASHKIAEAAMALPQEQRENITALISQIEETGFRPDRETHGKFATIKSICEGASGNLAAEAIMSLISRLFG